VREAFGWSPSERIEWLSRRKADDYADDESFQEQLGATALRVPLHEFWPKSGPRWDALARTDQGKLILGRRYPTNN
jgi:hypothetical protein